MDLHRHCPSCKYIKQTDSCCVCSHPEQINQELKNYVYTGDSCDLYEWLTPEESEERDRKQLEEEMKQYLLANKEKVRQWLNENS